MQYKVLALLAKGYSNKMIAKELGIALKTVKAHIYTLFNKMQCMSRIQLAVEVTYALHPELVPFRSGDRAARLGFLSAQEHYRNIAIGPFGYDCSRDAAECESDGRRLRGD